MAHMGGSDTTIAKKVIVDSKESQMFTLTLQE